MHVHVDEGTRIHIGWREDAPGVHVAHKVLVETDGTTGAPDYEKGVRVLARVFAHILLNCVPETGLNEALDSLNRIRFHYATIPAVRPTPGPTRRKGRVAVRATRPELQIDEE